MFLPIWNYFRGYVMIEVSGFSVERFINLATHKGIYLWDVQRTKNAIQMKVSIAGFRLLKHCAKKTKCRIKIIGKQGWPFVAHRYRKRKLLAIGIGLFIFILYGMSSFIWVIEIQGNERIQKQDLVRYSIEEGLKPGAWKRKIDTKQLQQRFMDQFHEISWIAIDLKGTKAKIELVESVPKPEIIDRSTPCDIVAREDGLIVSIVTSIGTPKVKQKDVVQKGDILVSGELIVKEDETGTVKNYVHATAEIKAKLWYEVYTEIPLTYMEKKYTGEVKKRYGIQILEYDINLLKRGISFENYDKITNRKRLDLGGDFALPVEWIVEAYKEFIPEEKMRSLEAGKKLVDASIDARLKELIEEEAEIVDRQIQYEQDGKRLKARAIISTIERIDEEKKMTEDWRNHIDGTEGEGTKDPQ